MATLNPAAHCVMRLRQDRYWQVNRQGMPVGAELHSADIEELVSTGRLSLIRILAIGGNGLWQVH